mgnify:CR=1 FL=1|tara:strand:+ start:1529 stop:2029 length:501 start_codon:yes stop_codon:yes gene_type:complete
MKRKGYTHPALSNSFADRELKGIVTCIIFSSRSVQIIDITCSNESCIAFISRKIFSDTIGQGSCLSIHGEDRHKDYYGDVFIANKVTHRAPTVDIFFPYSIYHFHFFSRHQLEQIIEGDRRLFVNAIKDADVEYIMQVTHSTAYIGKKFIEFCQLHLSCDGKYEAV